jgi:hypothetical protein
MVVLGGEAVSHERGTPVENDEIEEDDEEGLDCEMI